MQNNLDTIKRKAIPVLKKAGITKSAIFGSYVRGDYTEDSDIDILIEAPVGMSLFEMGGLQMDLEEAMGKKVDLINYETLKSRIRPYILKEQIQLI